MKELRSIMLGLLSIHNLIGELGFPKEDQTDAENIASDWQAVGGYIRNSLNKYSANI